MNASYPAVRRSSATTPAQRYDALLGALSNRIVNGAVGTEIPVGTRVSDETKRRLWLGMLASAPELAEQAAAGYTERRTPPAQGFTFRVAKLPSTLELEVSCAVYLALHPTWEEQDKAVHGERELSEEADTPPDGAPVAANVTRRTGHKLALVWTKIDVPAVRIRAEMPTGPRGAKRVGEEELAAAIRAATRPPANGQLYRPRRPTSPVGSLPDEDDLRNESTWSRYVAKNLLDPALVSPPEHRAAIDIEVTPSGDDFEVLVTVVNTTPANSEQTYDGKRPYDPSYLDTQLYEVQLIARTDAELRSYDLEQVAKSYRYDRSVPALGHACPVAADITADGTELRTLFAAEEPTARVYPRKTARDGDREVELDTSFDSLIADPVATVEALLAAHERWVELEWSKTRLDELAEARGWGENARREAERDALAAREEVEWVRAGLDLLRTDPDVRDAFVAANKVLKRDARDKYSEWHPFQVAWIVGCLPGMVDPATHQEVSIVWFATGGGKSEAYLGLMLVTLFYGRYTGITAGAQVWARFPLRLLALQQTERFASMVLNAELIRQADPRISGGDPFGLGYFVGGGNTPNKLQRPDASNIYYRGQDPFDPKTWEACRFLERCPVCRDDARLEVRFDEPTWTMQHICLNGACPMAGVLPVWGVDDDVYRHAPAVIVGTVDKLAQLGQNQAFQILLGRPHSRCPAHGYTATPQWCAVFGCKQARHPVPKGFGHIRLEIADELHLLDESLGALDGMYETLLQTISRSLRNPPFQIVGATATIEGYQNQVNHLYKRTARRFPASGPVAGETFWSYTGTNDPLRRYLGVRTRASTMITATREVALTHDQWVRDLVTEPAKVVAEAGLNSDAPGIVEEARAAGRELYEVLVAYCLRNEDLANFTRDPDVKSLLVKQGNLVTINSDAGPGEIRSAVRRLIKPPSDPEDRVKIVAATKAIGHGFDVHRLGVMAIMGTPTQAAEIIQASARVGRRYPGLVVNVINPIRERDASVFRYYAAWIRYLDRLVHKVPVNRESLPVLKRVLSGGLMAWLLQVHDRSWVTGGRRRDSLAKSTGFRDAVRARDIGRDLLISNLSRGFGIDPTSVYHQMHRDAIASWVDDQLAALPLRAESGKRLPDLLHPPVPRSLRDVEEPIVIYGEL
jgi:hypothetical protein